MVQGVFKVGDTLDKSIESFLANTSSRRLWYPQIGKGFLEFEELLLERCHSSLQITEVFVLESFKLGPQTVKLIPKLFKTLIDLLDKELLHISGLLVSVSSQFKTQTLQVLGGLALEG